MNFKSKNSFDDRKLESARIIAKYSNKIPVICEKSTNTKDIPSIEKIKFLVPNDLTCGQFISVIRSRMKLGPGKAIFLFVDNTIPSGSEIMINVYHRAKDSDGFLYITYSGENTFG